MEDRSERELARVVTARRPRHAAPDTRIEGSRAVHAPSYDDLGAVADGPSAERFLFTDPCAQPIMSFHDDFILMAELDAEAQQTVERTVIDLLADHERQGDRLSLDQVERLIDERNLSSTASLAVYQSLSEHGIVIAEDTPGTERPSRIAGESTRTAVPIGAIFSDALCHSVLSPAEEVELGRRIELARQLEADMSAGEVAASAETDRILQRGDEARIAFVLHNIRLVHAIARRYGGISGIPVADLLQEGTIGLMRAVELFDHTKGFKFSTYATWWIRQAITRSIIDRGPTIRLPVHLAEKLTKLRRAERRLTQATSSRPSVQDIADELDWKPENVARLQAVSRIGVISLDAPKDEEKGSGTIVDTIVSETPGPEDIAVARDLGLYLRRAMEGLKPRERIIIMKRFGFDDGNPKTLEQLGEEFGVTRERIRQIEAKALKHLRHPLRSRPLKVFVEHA
jgi:RNA polymerase primary sigma factor